MTLLSCLVFAALLLELFSGVSLQLQLSLSFLSAFGRARRWLADYGYSSFLFLSSSFLFSHSCFTDCKAGGLD